MDIYGLDELIDSLSDSSNNMSKMLEVSVNKIGTKLLREVKLNSPVDTGQYRRSWRIKKRGQFETIVYNNTEYSKPLEYGHRTKNGSFVEGQYILTWAVDKVKGELDQELKDIISDIW